MSEPKWISKIEVPFWKTLFARLFGVERVIQEHLLGDLYTHKWYFWKGNYYHWKTYRGDKCYKK